MKRVGIYFFYDKDGIVDGLYSIYDLQLIKRNFSRTQPQLELERYLKKLPFYKLCSKYHPFPSKRKHYTQKIEKILLSKEIKNNLILL